MRISALLMLLPVATFALYACDGGETDDDTAPAGYEDVVYAGELTDEALAAFASALDQKAPVDSPSNKATLDTPADAAALPKSPIATFTWHIGTTVRRAAPPSSDRWAGLDAAPRQEAFSFASPLRELFGPVRVAHAHGTPFTGTATFLVFSTDANPKLARVLTSGTSYTPSQAAWDKMAAAGKPITLTFMTALFEQNRVLQDGGPFAGSATTFTVTP